MVEAFAGALLECGVTAWPKSPAFVLVEARHILGVEALEAARDNAGAVAVEMLGVLLDDSWSRQARELAEHVLKMLGTQVKRPDSPPAPPPKEGEPRK